MGPIIVMPHRDEDAEPLTAEAKATIRADVEADLWIGNDSPGGWGCTIALLVGIIATAVAFWWPR